MDEMLFYPHLEEGIVFPLKLFGLMNDLVMFLEC
jgi:hypothetical protein